MLNRSDAPKLSPAASSPSGVKAGNTTVGNIARDEPITIPSIK